MIDLSILKEYPEIARNVKLVISGADLLAFGESLQKKATEDGKNAPKETEEYMTPAQFADALQVSLVTLWSWDKKNITRPLRIGNKKRYRRSDLEKIMSHE